jgi:hypothetical protein
VSRSAVVTQAVAREPGEQLVVFLNLGKLRPPATLSASVTHGALPRSASCGLDVRAMLVRGEPPALARLAANASANLVDLGGLGTGRDEPLTAALVAGEDLVAVKLEQAEPAKDVSGLWFGGDWWCGTLYTRGVHMSSFRLWAWRRGGANSCGAVSMSTNMVTEPLRVRKCPVTIP